MCNLVMHAGQGYVVQSVLDLYKESKYSQREVILITRRMRFEEDKSDEEIIAFLGLRKESPFIMDKKYLKGLIGFVTSRPSLEQDNMHENWRKYQTGKSRAR